MVVGAGVVGAGAVGAGADGAAVVTGAGGAALGEADSTMVPELTVLLQFGQSPETTAPSLLYTTDPPPQLEQPEETTGAEQPQLETGAGAEQPQLETGAGAEQPQLDTTGAGVAQQVGAGFAQHLGAGLGAQHFGAGAQVGAGAGQQPLLRRPSAKLTSATLATMNNAAKPAKKNRFIEHSPF